MKAHKAVYRNGHFRDSGSGQRIFFVQGADYIIVANEEAFALEDGKMERPSEPLNAEAKWQSLLKKRPEHGLHKIADADTLLYFRIGISKQTSGDESHEYLFACRLLEDQYVYLKKGATGKEFDDWRLEKCLCRLEGSVSGKPLDAEPLTANSLNKLFNKTLQHYFSNQRSAATNAFDNFFFGNEAIPPTMQQVKEHWLESVGDRRAAWVKQFGEEQLQEKHS